MKPEQLNRLIRGNGRVQPWFLRNTSEIYESAVRSYYEHGASGHTTHKRHSRLPHQTEENPGPIRKLKKAETKPSYLDEYPRSHQMQAKQAQIIASGQLLPKRIQTSSRQRSISFSLGGKDMASGGRPYSILGKTEKEDCSSTNVSSTNSQPSDHMLGTASYPRCLQKSRAMARRERKVARQEEKDAEENNTQQLDMDMRLFSARSLSVPPPTGLGMGNALPGRMPPCRKHHMNAIEKTTLAKPPLIPMGEGDSLMTVDEALKRKISVVDSVKGHKTNSELGHHLTTKGNGNLRTGSNIPDVIRQPPKMRFRFHTLGDRAKQFEYIQFADGPVSSYAFNRRSQVGGYPRRLHKGSSTSSSSSLNTIGRQDYQQVQPQQQSRTLTGRNVLYANHMQRSRSLEATSSGHRLETPEPPPVPEVKDVYRNLETLRSTRGSSVDLSSRLSARKHPSAENSASSSSNHGQINAEGVKSIKWADNTEENPKSKSLRTDTLESRVSRQSSRHSADAGPLERSYVTNSRTMNPDYRVTTVTPKQNSNYSAHNESNGTPRDIDWRGSSTTKAQSQRLLVGASFKGSSVDPSDAASGIFVEESRPYPAHHEPARITCTAVRRAQLQQSPSDEDFSNSLSRAQARTKHKVKATLEKPKQRVCAGNANRLSRSSHRSFYQAAQEENLSAGHATDKCEHNQKQEESEKKSEKSDKKSEKKSEKSDQREPNLDMQRRVQGSRAIPVPSSQPVKAALQLRGNNHLLAASATQVSAYKRAYRNHQQMLKVEALHQQAQSMKKPNLKLNPSRSSETRPHVTPLQLPAADLRPFHLPRVQGRQGPTLAVSRTSVRAALKATADGKIKRMASRNAANGSPRSPVKAAATPVTAPLTAGGKPTSRQKSQTPRTPKASGKGAVSGAATATKAAAGTKTRTKPDGGDPQRNGAVGRAMRQSAVMQAVQQQYSCNGNGSNCSGKGSPLLGYRRDTVNRAALSLQQRRDESDLKSAQNPQHRKQHQHQHQRQQQQQQRLRYQANRNQQQATAFLVVRSCQIDHMRHRSGNAGLPNGARSIAYAINPATLDCLMVPDRSHMPSIWQLLTTKNAVACC
ncbi:uncharacterized protein LOC110184549 [Drosophila serrata]|uniref:uncharacterized protein LOC110184549 n=1 Tax=Drosophila serrata TaxID=7274 RepID=UPI000A1D1F5D|nr:uncharacterized protein LOC110184549 [Drosophila serrata]